MMKNFFISLTAALFFFIFVINEVSAQCTESFDDVTAPALPAGWSAATLTDCVGSNPWITSTTLPNSAPNSAFVNAPGCISDEVLVSRPFSITTTSAQLTFRRKNDLELDWDGLVLEISIDGGSFVDILVAGGSFVVGGYTVQLNSGFGNPLSGRLAWTGSTSNAFVTTTVNLPAPAIGKIVIFRWRRGTDSTNHGTGVYIDNIGVTGCSTSACAESFDGLTAPALPFGWIAYTASDCTGSNPWATTTNLARTIPNSVFVNDPDSISDEYLYSKVFQIVSTSAQIVFSRNNSFETPNYDGLVLEISIGGLNFTDIIDAGCSFVTGEYNGTISNGFENPLANRSAWIGVSDGWITSRIDLPVSANGKSVILRWRRGTDRTVSGSGVYIDSLAISGSLCNPVCGTNVILSPAGGSLCSSNPVVLTASVAGPAYEWYRNDVKINGVSGNTYAATTAGIYYVRTIISGCLVTSNVAVLEPGSIVPSLGGTGIYCLGDAVNVGIPQTEVEQNYTWLRNGTTVLGPVGGNGGNQSLQFNMVESRVGTYIVKSTKPGCTEVYSSTVYVGFAQINNLMTTSICASGVTFKWSRVAPVNISQTYEYEVTQSSTPTENGTLTSDSNITVTSLNPSTLYYIHVRAACGFGSTFGNWSTISFTTSASSVSLSPTTENVCNNTKLLTATSNAVSYVWYRNGNIIDGATGSTYNVSQAGTYRVEAIVNGCTNVSNNAVVTETTVVAPIVDLGTISVTSKVYCTNALAEVRLTNSQPSQQYTWYRNGSSIGGNGGNQSLALAVSSSTVGEYDIITSKTGCGDETSNSVDVIEARVTNLQTTAICSNQVSFEWNSLASGENYQYVVDQILAPPSNPVNPGTTSLTTATVSSLNASTIYHIHLRAASGPNYTSFCNTWTTISFTTPASNPILEWTGALNTSWTNPSNWTCGQVPGSTSEVIIDGGKPNYPLITSNTTIKKLTVNSGASVNVQPGVTLTITSQ